MKGRSLLIVALLGATLVLVLLLALQAHYAWTYHRGTAESVLRDYSRLVAEEFIRRASQTIGYQGFHGTIATLQQELGRGAPGAWPVEPGGLVRTLFLVDPAAGSIVTTGEGLGPEAEARLLARVRSAVGKPGGSALGPMFGVHETGTAGQRFFVATGLAAGPGGPARVAGFEVDREALAARFQAIVDARPLLPVALGDGTLTNDLLFLRMTDAAGRTVWSAGEARAPALATVTRLGDTYGGVFEGLALEASIDPRAASRLVIGGLPRSRLPLLMVLLGLTAGLLGAAVWQVHRERALARLREDFVAQVSHELRTPLTQIVLFAQTLRLGRTRSDVEAHRSLEIIDQEARRLSHLVDNVLSFSGGRRERVRLAPRRLELASLVRDQAEKFRPLAQAKQVRIATVANGSVEVVGDEAALRQVVLNLLDNAVKYGPPGQEVRVGLEPDRRLVRLFVEDQGPGVPERDRERIWSAWQRLPRDRRRAISGTGIGLTVVRELVSRHGGRAFVERALGGGARFVVELPRASGGAPRGETSGPTGGAA